MECCKIAKFKKEREDQYKRKKVIKMNKKTRVISEEEAELILSTIRKGYIDNNGVTVRPNIKVFMALLIEYQFGLRVYDATHLKLSDFKYRQGGYSLSVVEKKTGKIKECNVSSEIYAILSDYCNTNGIKKDECIAAQTTRNVQKALQKVTQYLGLEEVGTHSFRKLYGTILYERSNYNIKLVSKVFQHSSVAITERYIGVSDEETEKVLAEHRVMERMCGLIE